MIVVIEQEVFSSPQTSQLTLTSVLKLGFEGRHRIQTQPVFGTDEAQAIQQWLERQDEQLRAEVELAFESGFEADAHGIPSDHAITIADIDASDWDSTPPRLPIDVAECLLRAPLQLILENRRNDRAFLERVSFEPWRSRLKDAFSDGRLKPSHGGGLAEIKQRVVELAGNSGARLRHWVLFDSDAREPDQPSEDSERLRQACQDADIGHHQLQRRASENYIPQQALHAWAHKASSNVGTSKRKTAEAFSQMEPPQRHYFNMKRGFNGDRKGGGEIPDFFGNWPQSPALASGFGSNVTNIFSDNDIEFFESWLLRDKQRDETMSLIQAIFRAL